MLRKCLPNRRALLAGYGPTCSGFCSARGVRGAELPEGEVLNFRFLVLLRFLKLGRCLLAIHIRTEIRDVPFLIYIRQEQNRRPKHHKLNVYQLMAIYNVCFGDGLEVKAAMVDELVEEGILLRSRTGKLSMAKEYQSFYSEIHSAKNINWIGAMKSCAAKYIVQR